MYAEQKTSGERIVGQRNPGGLGSAEMHLPAGESEVKTVSADAAEMKGSTDLSPAEMLLRRNPHTRPGDTEPARPAEKPQTEGKKPPAADGTAQKPGRTRKLAVLGLVALAALGAGGWFGYHWWTVGRFVVSTDDAYVRASNTTLAAKVSGYVARLLINDNDYVQAGQVIATIDDGDYRLAVDSARDKVATQQATVDRIGQQVIAQQASVEQAQAQLVSARAGAKRAQSELERQQALATRDYASKQTLEQALANRDQGNAGVQSAQAALDAANANVAVLKAQQQEAARTIDELKTALAKAERDLSFTVIRSPIDGVFGNRAMQVGDYVTPGQRLASLVPLDDVYIDANFKETQLAGLRAGQKVDITIDALPGQPVEGRVASLAPASGSVFSLLPPDNATGNFTKIVQRVPVRIRVPLDVAAQRVLRPGMSVVVSINTRGAKTAANTPVAAWPTRQMAN
jgi:membrane fusion protein (multidrug efflux system)